MKFIFSLFITSLFFFGCAPQQTPSQVKKSSSSATIIGGSLVAATDSIASHVVLVHDMKGDYVCTGTLIAKNVVLTAAHCLSKKHLQFEIIFSRQGYQAMDQHDPLNIRKATQVVVHKDYEYNENLAPEADQSDLGLIYFAGTLPAGYSPVPMMLDPKILTKGSKVILAGYGVSHVTSTEVKYKKSKKFQNKIKSGEIVCDDSLKDQDGDPLCMEVYMSSNGELMKTQAQVKYLSFSEFVLDEQKTGTCEGDSGGPVFIESQGQIYLVGLTSRGDLLCNYEGVYTYLPSFSDWLTTH